MKEETTPQTPQTARTPEHGPVPEIKDLRVEVRGKKGRVDLVEKADLTIAAGETVGLVGESGSGKTITSPAVMRLLPANARMSGSVLLEGRGISGVSSKEVDRLRGVDMAMIFQDPYKSLEPKMQIGAALAEPMLAQGGYDKAERAERIEALMKRVGLGPQFLERFPYEMSGGRLQRVAIARALMTDPGVVVCDEPVAALDMSMRSQAIGLLRDLQDERGLAYLFVSHDMSLVRAIRDRVAVMRQGEVVECATPERLLERPEHPCTRTLLTAIAAPHPSERTFRPRPRPRHRPQTTTVKGG